jgi:hypothetical protein
MAFQKVVNFEQAIGVPGSLFDTSLHRVTAYKLDNINHTQDVIGRFGPAAKEWLKILDYKARIKKQFHEVYGVPDWHSYNPEIPCDTLFKAIRGMKGFSIDLRRNTRYVEQALEMIDAYFFPPVKKIMENIGDPDDLVFPGGRVTSLVHTVLSPKQFEKYYWPYLKRWGDLLVQHDLIGSLFMEGGIEGLYDYLQELPKGHIALLVEQCDVVQAKKLLPNLTITGGFPTYLLGNGTPEQCVDKAKELIDAMAGDGNYIFTADKMLSFRNDAKSENFVAINQFLKEYAVF